MAEGRSSGDSAFRWSLEMDFVRYDKHLTSSLACWGSRTSITHRFLQAITALTFMGTTDTHKAESWKKTAEFKSILMELEDLQEERM